MSSALPPRPSVTDTVLAPHRLALGLNMLDEHTSWLEIDEGLPSDLQEKRRLLRDHREQVLVELPSSRPAQREVLERVCQTLVRQYPKLYSRESSRLHQHFSGEEIDLDDATLPPLELTARCVQEDLCVMEKQPAGWCLTAGVVCFPTRWDLPSKLGLPMTSIHAPVPGYREALGDPTDRFFDGMKPSRVFRRGNWSLLDESTLFLPIREHPPERGASITVDNAGESLWLRVEHQTLQRLPVSDSILFTIRIHRTRLDKAASDPQRARTLSEALQTMSPGMQVYKSLKPILETALAYLERRSRA